MKFMELTNITRTNRLFEKLREFDPKRTIDIEVYSCKQTKHQKTHWCIPKPFRFYISALEMAFPDYDFSQETIDIFKEVDMEAIKKELSFVFFTMYRNCEDVSEMVHFIEQILEQCVDTRKAQYYTVDTLFGDEAVVYKLYIIYDKKAKRVLIVKSLCESESD